MPTVGAYVDDDTFIRYKKTAEDNNLSISAVIKQAFDKAEIVDVKQIKSLDIARLVALTRIMNNLTRIAQYCDTKKVVDNIVFSALMEIQDDCKNL